MIKLWLIALLFLPVVFAQPTTHDHILTDEMQSIDAGVKKLSGLAEKEKFAEIEKELKTIEKNWGNIRAELYLRGAGSAAGEFESALGAVKEALNVKDKDRAIQSSKQFNAAFENVTKVLKSAEIDASRFLTVLGFFAFAWVLLTISVLKISEKTGLKG